MISQKQTDSRLSSRDRRKSNKKLAQIRIHIKTQKANKIEVPSLHRNSFTRDHSKQSSLRDNSTSSLHERKKEIKWSIARSNNTALMRAILPQIMEYRGASEWIGKNYQKKSSNKSTKIQFRQLVPIKEISKEDRMENLRKIRDEFREVVNTSNNVAVRNSESVFRAYVQKGNNGVLVKELIKKRYWWHLEDNPAKANLFWTEWFGQKYILDMPQLYPQPDFQYESQPLCNQRQSLHHQPKINSIRMIVDDSTFTKIKPRISIRDQHYLKNQNKSLNVRQNIVDGAEIKQIEPHNSTMHNHIDGCLQLHSKKLLFKNFYSYLKKKGWDPFEFMPVTYYLQNKDEAGILRILDHYDSIQQEKEATGCHNIWIVKPGENSNRGFGITIHSDRAELSQQLSRRLEDDKRSVIVQKYLQNCFLVHNRKFDIRCYILITTVNGYLKGYWYNDGYIRTSSEEYNLEDCGNRMIHLTNDAVQKHNPTYGKFQDFNKMSFINFRKYITKVGFYSQQFDEAYNQMKLIAYYLIASVSPKIRRKQYTFQLFGLDFMLDSKLKPLLIEANSNPCLETSGVILGKLIPQLVDNVLMTAVDPLFPPPNKAKPKEFLSKDYFRSNKFQLIFSELDTATEGKQTKLQSNILP